MASQLQASIEALFQNDTEHDTTFSKLRRIVLHNKAQFKDCNSLPTPLIRKSLKVFAGASKVSCNQAQEVIRIIGVSRAAALAKHDTKLIDDLKKVFTGTTEVEEFGFVDPDGYDVLGAVDVAVCPDPAKAQEVHEMQVQHNKLWPNLHYRFRQGSDTAKPDDVLALVLETVDYILTPVRKTDLRELPVIVLVGITGSGKSVTCNWLAGKRIEKIPDLDEDGDEEGTQLQVRDPDFAVGYDSFSSKTFAPTVKRFEDFVLIDFPGNCDTSRVAIRIGMDIAFREMVSLVKPARILGLLPIESFTVGRGTVAKQQISKLQRLLPTLGAPLGAGHVADNQSASVWKIGVTKCDKDFTTKPKTLFKEAVKFLTEFDEVLGPHVLNMNEYIFSGKDSAPKEFIDTLLRDTHTPNRHGLAAWLTKTVFGGDSGDIGSDCLNPNDTAWFGRVFMSEDFEKEFIQHDLAQVKRCASFANSPTDDEGTWESFAALIDAQVEELCNHTNSIIEDSKGLIDHGTLSLERRSPDIKKVCGFNQCRLKLCFVQAEEKIMMSNLKSSIQLNEELFKSAEALKSQGFLRDTDFEEVLKAYEESSKKMVQNARDVGFTDTKSLLGATIMMGGIAACGGVAIGTATAMCSATLPVYWAGTGALSAAATAGFLTGGLVLVIGGAVFAFAKVARLLRAHGDEYSEQMKEKLILAFKALTDANDAATKHKTAPGGITSTLRSLEVQLRD